MSQIDWGDLWLLYWFWCSDCGVVVGTPRRSCGEEGWELPPASWASRDWMGSKFCWELEGGLEKGMLRGGCSGAWL